jgi:hypothetical protein
MSQKRSLTTGFLVASLGLAAGLAVFSAPVSAADCGSLKESSVKAHCDKGGVAAVKKAMKAAVDAANAAGEKGPDGKKLECKTCHENSTDFKQNDHSVELYGKHLKKYFK